MEQNWTAIFLASLGETAIERFANIAKRSAELLGTFLSLFPVPGPDADARISLAFLNLADAFDVFDTFILEAMARTIARLPIPKDWNTRVIKANVALQLVLSAAADAIYESSQVIDQPAEFTAEAAFIQRARNKFSLAWTLAIRDYIGAFSIWLKQLFHVTVLKLLALVVRIIDLGVKIVIAIAGALILARLLAQLQSTWESQFLSQAAPRARLRPRTPINRRLGGANP